MHRDQPASPSASPSPSPSASAPASAPPATPRHQESPEGLLDFSTAAPRPTPRQLADALLLYTAILADCERDGIPLSPAANTPLLHPFFLALHEHCPAAGKSNVLFAVLHALFPPPLPRDYTSPLHRDPAAIIPRAQAWLNPTFTPTHRSAVHHRLQAIADDLLRGFFIPLQAAGGHTPAHPHDDADPQSTPARLSELRAACLLRDDNRCVITRTLDYPWQRAYNVRNPDNPSEEDSFCTKATHIIPHSLNAQNADGQLGDARTYLWRIMDMFDPGISHTLAGTAIDSPRNALTLCTELHVRFGQLRWYLEPTRVPHSYTLHLVRGERLPYYLLPPEIITFNAAAVPPPPDPRLLAFHRACCLMLGVSGAGECVDRVLRDMEEMAGAGVLAADGSSDLGQFWKLREVLGGVC